MFSSLICQASRMQASGCLDNVDTLPLNPSEYEAARLSTYIFVSFHFVACYAARSAHTFSQEAVMLEQMRAEIPLEAWFWVRATCFCLHVQFRSPLSPLCLLQVPCCLGFRICKVSESRMLMRFGATRARLI